MRKITIDENDYIDLQRLNDDIERLEKMYRYKHLKTYLDHTAWVEAVDKLKNIIFMQRENLIENVKLLEEI